MDHTAPQPGRAEQQQVAHLTQTEKVGKMSTIYFPIAIYIYSICFFSISCKSSLENDFCVNDRKLGQKNIKFRRSLINHHQCLYLNVLYLTLFKNIFSISNFKLHKPTCNSCWVCNWEIRVPRVSQANHIIIIYYNNS